MSNTTKPPYWKTLRFSFPLANRLLRYFPMNEGMGDIVKDLSLHRRYARNIGAIWGPGKDGMALRFGKSKYIDCGDGLHIGKRDFSIYLWFKTSSKAEQVMLSNSFPSVGIKGYTVLLVPGGYPAITISDGAKVETIIADNSYADGKWHQYFATVDRDREGIIYIDGNLVKKGLVLGADEEITMEYDHTEIGRRHFLSDNTYFFGSLDNIAIFDCVVTPGIAKRMSSEPFILFR